MATLSVPTAGTAVTERRRDRSSEMAGRRKSGRIFRAYRDRGRLALCRGCLGRFAPPNKHNALYCSRECYQRTKKDGIGVLEQRAVVSLRRTQREREREHPKPVATVLYEAACRICGGPFMRAQGTWERLCSGHCRAEAKRRSREVARPHQKRAKRVRKHIVRAAFRGRPTERFDPIDVFRRDGWRCQRCGIRCLPKYKHRDDRSPTLDHIVPISRGGGHTWANVQLLCCGCNMAKSDSVGGDQLRLFTA